LDETEGPRQMSIEERYIVSKDLILEGIDSHSDDRTIVNTVTGNCLKISRETMKILTVFRRATSLRRAATRLGLERGSDIRQLKKNVAALADAYFLVDAVQPHREAEKAFRRAIEKECFIQPPKAFADCEKVRPSELRPGDVVIAGVPIDFATSGRPGSRYGPGRLRDVSIEFVKCERDPFTGRNRGWYNADINRTVLGGVRLVDVGDIFARPADGPGDVFERCYNGAKLIHERRAFPVFLGGDHSISAPLIKAAADAWGSLTVVHLDAHTDRAEWNKTDAHHHGNVMTRVLRENPRVRIFQYGVRGFIGKPSLEPSCQVIPQRMIEDNLRRVLSREIPTKQKCYLSIDLDVLDPAVAPGTGTPVPMGMQPRVVLKLVEAIAARNRIVGLDLVELSPEPDRDSLTTSLAFHLLSAILGLACGGKRGGRRQSGKRLSST
jgi:agmatinase